MDSPPPGTMVYWRRKDSFEWRFGYCTHVNSRDLVRMGRWNGDTAGGVIVCANEIEWRPYQ